MKFKIPHFKLNWARSAATANSYPRDHAGIWANSIAAGAPPEVVREREAHSRMPSGLMSNPIKKAPVSESLFDDNQYYYINTI